MSQVMKIEFIICNWSDASRSKATKIVNISQILTSILIKKAWKLNPEPKKTRKNARVVKHVYNKVHPL